MHETVFQIHRGGAVIGRVVYRCEQHVFAGTVVVDVSEGDVLDVLTAALHDGGLHHSPRGYRMYPSFHRECYEYVERAVNRLAQDRFLSIERIELTNPPPEELFLSRKEAIEILDQLIQDAPVALAL